MAFFFPTALVTICVALASDRDLGTFYPNLYQKIIDANFKTSSSLGRSQNVSASVFSVSGSSRPYWKRPILWMRLEIGGQSQIQSVKTCEFPSIDKRCIRSLSAHLLRTSTIIFPKKHTVLKPILLEFLEGWVLTSTRSHIMWHLYIIYIHLSFITFMLCTMGGQRNHCGSQGREDEIRGQGSSGVKIHRAQGKEYQTSWGRWRLRESSAAGLLQWEQVSSLRVVPPCATVVIRGHPWSSVVSGCEVELVWDIHRAGAATDIVVIRLMKSEIQAEIGCNKCI